MVGHADAMRQLASNGVPRYNPPLICKVSFCRSSPLVCNSVNVIQYMKKCLSVLHQVRAAAHRVKENGQRLAADAPCMQPPAREIGVVTVTKPEKMFAYTGVKYAAIRQGYRGCYPEQIKFVAARCRSPTMSTSQAGSSLIQPLPHADPVP